jgi:hypothetical protein
MVEGDDRTDRSSARRNTGDNGRQPDSPEELDWNRGPKRPSKSARNWNLFPTPRLAAVHEVPEYVVALFVRQRLASARWSDDFRKPFGDREEDRGRPMRRESWPERTNVHKAAPVSDSAMTPCPISEPTIRAYPDHP